MEELKCDKCGSGDVYTTQENVRVCRRCGHRKELTKRDKKNG